MEGLIAVSIMIVICICVVGASTLYRMASRNGRALREHELRKEIYEVIWSGVSKDDTIILLRNAKGEVLSCCIPAHSIMELYSIEGNILNGLFLVPKKYQKLTNDEIMIGGTNHYGDKPMGS